MYMAIGMSATEYPWVLNTLHRVFIINYELIIELYQYTIYFNTVLVSVFIIANIYSLLWVSIPWFGKLRSVMRAYKNNKREAAKKENEKPVDEKILGDLYHIYYKNRDLNLFLELLAMGSGVAPAISFMTLFDSVSVKFFNFKNLDSG